MSETLRYREFNPITEAYYATPEVITSPTEPEGLGDVARILTGVVLVEPLPVRPIDTLQRDGAAILRLTPELSAPTPTTTLQDVARYQERLAA